MAVSPAPSNDAPDEAATSTPTPKKSKPKMTKEAAEQNVACINPPSEVNARLDTQVEVRVYPCNNSSSDRKKKFTQFMVKPEVSVFINTLDLYD